MAKRPGNVRVKIKKASKRPLASIKRKAWGAFSLWIRQRDSVNGMNYCISCGEQKPIKSLQAGHLIDGRGNSILFEESGVHPQCLVCNVFKHGNKIMYMQALEKKLGTTTAILLRDELQRLSKSPKKFDYDDYEKIYLKYKQ